MADVEDAIHGIRNGGSKLLTCHLVSHGDVLIESWFRRCNDTSAKHERNDVRGPPKRSRQRESPFRGDVASKRNPRNAARSRKAKYRRSSLIERDGAASASTSSRSSHVRRNIRAPGT